MNDILFLTLRTFSATGGIEKMCRIIGKAVFELGKEKDRSVSILSMYDKSSDAEENQYFPTEIFHGSGERKFSFVYRAVAEGRKSRVVVLSHFNLLTVAKLIKKVNPSVKVIMLAHGIEVWNTLPPSKRKSLSLCDEILCVSNFTRDRIISVHGLNAGRCKVLNNCLDPYLGAGAAPGTIEGIRQKYGFMPSDKVIFTLARLSSREKYKGYDMVIRALALLKDKYPRLRYLLSGGYDNEEKDAVLSLASESGVGDRVTITGYLPDSEFAAHFQAADMYVMPSREEGFGIVFIEAMKFGLPVIGGKADGTVDALQNGELGILVDPNNEKDLAHAIEKLIIETTHHLPDQKKLEALFGFTAYKRKLNYLLQPFI